MVNGKLNGDDVLQIYAVRNKKGEFERVTPGRWNAEARRGDIEARLAFCARMVGEVYNPKVIEDLVPERLTCAELYWALQDSLIEIKRLRAELEADRVVDDAFSSP